MISEGVIIWFDGTSPMLRYPTGDSGRSCQGQSQKKKHPRNSEPERERHLRRCRWARFGSQHAPNLVSSLLEAGNALLHASVSNKKITAIRKDWKIPKLTLADTAPRAAMWQGRKAVERWAVGGAAWGGCRTKPSECSTRKPCIGASFPFHKKQPISRCGRQTKPTWPKNEQSANQSKDSSKLVRLELRLEIGFNKKMAARNNLTAGLHLKTVPGAFFLCGLFMCFFGSKDSASQQNHVERALRLLSKCKARRPRAPRMLGGLLWRRLFRAASTLLHQPRNWVAMIKICSSCCAHIRRGGCHIGRANRVQQQQSAWAQKSPAVAKEL